ncbi:MAG: hypothetical protein R3C44_19975 [Chloroflexota bacterium]
MLVGAIVAILIVYRGRPPETVLGVVLAIGRRCPGGIVGRLSAASSWAKLGGQIVGVIILILFGIQVQLPIPEPLNILLTFFWIIGITNAINFLDNMDGVERRRQRRDGGV